MKTIFVAVAYLIFQVRGFALENEIPELAPKKFQFLRAERKTTSSRLEPDGPVVTSTATHGVFIFCYEAAKPLEFWGFGKPVRRKFRPRFTDFSVREGSEWQLISERTCGTGAAKYVLEPGVNYELRIPMLRAQSTSGSTMFRASLSAFGGTFWSEPFSFRYP